MSEGKRYGVCLKMTMGMQRWDVGLLGSAKFGLWKCWGVGMRLHSGAAVWQCGVVTHSYHVSISISGLNCTPPHRMTMP